MLKCLNYKQMVHNLIELFLGLGLIFLVLVSKQNTTSNDSGKYKLTVDKRLELE